MFDEVTRGVHPFDDVSDRWRCRKAVCPQDTNLSFSGSTGIWNMHIEMSTRTHTHTHMHTDRMSTPPQGHLCTMFLGLGEREQRQENKSSEGSIRDHRLIRVQ